MIDSDRLNKVLVSIIERKNKLATMSYDDPAYDDMEEALHDLEDEFQEEFGEALEEVLADIHDEYCPDNDVLMPIAYLANEYKEIKGKGNGTQYAVEYTQGVPVEADDYPSNIARLVIMPNPARIVLMANPGQEEVVWSAS